MFHTHHLQNIFQAMSDRLFLDDIEKAARLHNLAVKSPVYTYMFDYRGLRSSTEVKANCSDNIGESTQQKHLVLVFNSIRFFNQDELELSTTIESILLLKYIPGVFRGLNFINNSFTLIYNIHIYIHRGINFFQID